MLRKLKFPLVKGISLWDFLLIYSSGLIKGALGIRAAAISWSLFLSIFPFLLLIFGLLPYLPHYESFEKMIFTEVIPRFFPREVANYIGSYLKVILTRDFNLFNVTTLFAIVFATRGFVAIQHGFYTTGQDVLVKMNVIKTYTIALISLFQTFLLIVLALFTSYYSTFGVKFNTNPIVITFLENGFDIVIFFVFFILYLLYLMFLYTFGAQYKSKREIRHVLPGAFLTTVLFFLTTWLFRYYILWFNNYELLYGSIGLLLVVMLWLYTNVIIVLIGFELNIAITYAELGILQKKEEEDNLFNIEE